MIGADIRKQIAAGEGIGAAFIANPDDFSLIASTVCGFLNTRGGVVFVGVMPDGEILGIDGDPEAYRRRLEERLQAELAPRALFTFSIDVDDGHALITIEVPKGRDVPYVVEGRVFYRERKRTIVADPLLLRQIVQSRSVEPDRWERRPSLSLDEDDLNTNEIAITVEEGRESGRFAFEGAVGTASSLRLLNLATAGGYTNACDVLFATRPSVRHPQCRVRFLQYETDKTGSAFLDDAWVDGPLVEIYTNLIDRLAAHTRVQAHFSPNEHLRQERVNYSLEALREGIVNALAHRDYASFSGGVTVSIYANRVEIWNSGQLPKGITLGALKTNHPSIPTNPDIAHVLYLRRLMERVGRGTQKIIAACRELGAKPPVWKESPAGITLTIYASRGAPVARLKPRQAHMLERVRPGDVVRLRDYMEVLQVSERQARRDLVELEENGYLVRSGQGRATMYQRSERSI